MATAVNMRLSAETNRGFDPTPVAGTGLSTAQQATVKTRLAAQESIAQAILQAMARARGAGLTAFRPSDTQVLVMPGGISDAVRDAAFADVVGRAWSGSELSLAQWAEAANSLLQASARDRSSLPPGNGGGVNAANGTWYVNGQAFSLGELFVATRVNTYATLDALLQGSMNTIAANNRLVNRLNATLEAGRTLSSGNPRALVATYATFQAGRVWDPAYLLPDSVDWTVVRSLALAVVGSNSVLASSLTADSTLSGENWKQALEELSAVISSKTADNQIAQQRMESVMNVRTNLLDGLSNLLKGQQNMASGLNRNLGA